MREIDSFSSRSPTFICGLTDRIEGFSSHSWLPLPSVSSACGKWWMSVSHLAPALAGDKTERREREWNDESWSFVSPFAFPCVWWNWKARDKEEVNYIREDTNRQDTSNKSHLLPRSFVGCRAEEWRDGRASLEWLSFSILSFLCFSLFLSYGLFII